MSKISGKKEKLRSFGDHRKFLSRITKSLYYTKLPKTDRLSLPVTELASELFSEAKTGHSIERLHCNEAATISRNACVSPCSLVLALLYLDRLKSCNPEYLQRVVPSDLFLVSLMVSSKFLYDDGEEDEVCLRDWAISGGITTEELHKLEKEFLNAIQWEIFVGKFEFLKRLRLLETTIASREGLKRGWYTYTELQNLLTTIDIQSLVHSLLAFSAILLTAYTAAIMTIIGSMYLLSNIPGNCLRPTTSYESTTNNQSYNLPIDNLEPNMELVLQQPEVDITDITALTDIPTSNVILDELPGYKKPIDAVDVLKTGIILASIKSHFNTDVDCNRSCFDFNEEEKEVDNITWDWWSNSALVWLASTSKMVENFSFIPQNSAFKYDQYMEKCIANCKKLGLEDQVHRGTKLRMQDQLEHTWHKEWTDTITSALYSYRPFSYFAKRVNY